MNNMAGWLLLLLFSVATTTLCTGIIKDMVYAAIANGLIPDKTRGKEIVANYVRPDMDVSDLAPAELL
jgi:hypothetical protein